MEAIIQHLALVSESSSVQMSDLLRVAAALQKQASRDVAPIWNISATVDAFAKLEDVPLGYWPMIVKDDIGQAGAAGIHLDNDRQPYALISSSSDLDTWSLTASHECLEMLVDPYGDRLIAGDSPKAGQGRVSFLVEVCDPSEAAEFAYTCNGILVSDFYTPRYFDPLESPGVRYSFTGAITEPRQVLNGGYLSWVDSTTGHVRKYGLVEPDWAVGLPPHYLDSLQLSPEAVLVVYRTDRVRLAAERYVNRYDHLLLFSPRYPDGLEVARLGIDDGNLRAWRLVGSKLWLQTFDTRGDAPREFAWSLDLARVL